MFDEVYTKFLKAIDHMEYHPTLGKEKKGSSFRLHKRSFRGIDPQLAHQLRYLSPDDIEMLQQGNEMIQKKYLNINDTKHRSK